MNYEGFFKWAGEIIALLIKRRGKAYTRVAVALIALGGVTMGTSCSVLVVQAIIRVVQPGNSNDAPWWVTLGGGLALAITGVAIFVVYYERDLKNQKPAPLGTEGLATLSLPPAITFSGAATLVARHFTHQVRFENFSQAEKDAKLNATTLTGNEISMLEQLGGLAIGTLIEDYVASNENGLIIVRKK